MRRALIVPVIAGLLVTLAACGAKNEEAAPSAALPSASSSDQTSTTEGRSTTTDEEDPDDTTDDSTDVTRPDVTIPGVEDLDLPEGLSDECLAVVNSYLAVLEQGTAALDPSTTSADLAELESTLDEARAKIPSALEAPFDTWSAAWIEFAEIMQDVNTDGGMTNPANLDKLEQATKGIETPEVTAASQEIEEYVTQECDVPA
jgi:hypothetical protein